METEKPQLEKPQLITRDMPIGDVVKQYPQSAAIFTEYGLHCVGCHVAYWETLEQGARGHGMDDETINKMVEDANEIAVSSQTGINPEEPADLQVTSLAAQKIKEFMEKANKPDHMLRIQVVKGGCAGESYNFFFVKDGTSQDHIIEKDGVKIIIDNTSLDKIKGSQLDFVETMQGSGFKVNNPNAGHTCGCGSSFG